MTRTAASQQPGSSARSRTERHGDEDPINTRLSAGDSSRIPVPIRRPVARPWITVKEAAAYLNVGVDTIYKGIATGGLKHSRIGHSTIRLRREWVDAWAETLTRHSS